MKKAPIFAKIQKNKPEFWSLFHEQDPARFLSQLKASRFLEDPGLLLTPKTSALLIYCYSKKVVWQPDSPTKQRLLQAYTAHRDLMNHQDFVNVAWGFSRLCPENAGVFAEIEAKLAVFEKTLKIREKVTVIHSFARAKRGSERFWAEQQLFLERDLGFLGEKELAIVVWALSRAGRLQNSEFWGKIEKRVLEVRPRNIEFIASLCYSFGKAGSGSAGLWLYFEKSLVSELQNVKPRHFANIVWAFARAGKPLANPVLLAFIEKWVFQELKKPGFRDLYNVLWALNRMNRPEFSHEFWRRVFEGFTERMKLVSKMNPQDLMNFAWILDVRGGQNDYEGLWGWLRRRFLGYLEGVQQEIRAGTVNHREFLVKAHECFYRGQGGIELWREIGEAVYCEYVRLARQQRPEPPEITENLKEIGILAMQMDRVRGARPLRSC